MCLILFAIDAHRDHTLVLAANRDERHDRPTSPAAFWADAPGIFGGRDMEKGGTWLGATRRGRVVALTNVRSTIARRVGRSRGEIVRRMLERDGTLDEGVADVTSRAADYPAFNLVAFENGRAVFVTEDGDRPIAPGIHGLSNARLDDPWPKVVRGTKALGRELEKGTLDREAIFEILADHTFAGVDDLPSTGVAPEVERMLSPAFIVAPGYGTRSSTVVTVSRDGEIVFEERSFDAKGDRAGVVRERFR